MFRATANICSCAAFKRCVAAVKLSTVACWSRYAFWALRTAVVMLPIAPSSDLLGLSVEVMRLVALVCWRLWAACAAAICC